MEICFYCLRDHTSNVFENVHAVESDWAKISGRMTKVIRIYTEDGKCHSLKCKDNQLTYVYK